MRPDQASGSSGAAKGEAEANRPSQPQHNIGLSPSVQFDPYGTFLVDEALVQKQTTSRPGSPNAGYSTSSAPRSVAAASQSSYGNLPHHIVTQSYAGHPPLHEQSPSMFSPSSNARASTNRSAASPSPSPASSSEQVRRPILRGNRTTIWTSMRPKWGGKGNGDDMTLGDDTEEEKPPSQMVLYWRELKTSMKNTAKRPITAIRRTSLYIKYSRRYPHHLPPLKNPNPPPRQIHLNDVPANMMSYFLDNHVSMAKYNIVSFLPKFLYEQFSRLANAYFLVVSVIQMSSDILAPTGQYYTFIPLVIILILTAIKEVIEDVKRHRSDAQVNVGNKVCVLRHGHWVKVSWEEIKVGEYVRVDRDDAFPADLVLLSSSDGEGMAYIETSSLDGETNLKIRQSVERTKHIRTTDALMRLGGMLECDPPNNRLYSFEGSLRISGSDETIPLGPHNVLLRGSNLKQTKWVFAVVFSTGHETKLLQNANAAPIKQSRVERLVNKQIPFLFAILFAMGIACTIGLIYWSDTKAALNPYLFGGPVHLAGERFTNFIIYLIQFNTVVPISLYVTIEFVKLQGASFISNDILMYDEASDTAAVARTSNLNEELGCIKYLFSDKTGTLTRNIMEFRRCSIRGKTYGSMTDDRFGTNVSSSSTWRGPNVNFSDPAFAAVLQRRKGDEYEGVADFLKALAVCHTIIPEYPVKDRETSSLDFETMDDEQASFDMTQKRGVQAVYQASSPDEEALVGAARAFGFEFIHRSSDAIAVDLLGDVAIFQVLATIEFTSTRKRMSVIVREPDGTLYLYCKGADNVIYERLRADDRQQEMNRQTASDLDTFASEGLRTLCFAKRRLSEELYKDWAAEWHAACIAIEDRQSKQDVASERIEKELEIIGASAIEDKLQEGVQQTIQNLLAADIKVWMLTGDKRETAIQIGQACAILPKSVRIVHFHADTMLDLVPELKRLCQECTYTSAPMSLVVEGHTVGLALEKSQKEAKRLFLKLLRQSRSVICCRVSPIQKAKIVTLIQKSMKCTTLSIGDGANDVSMIQAAHVGVGISGREGLQAARSADYAIAQFRFIERLLLVHGTLAYIRLSKLILISFYKTLTLYLVSFYFNFANGFSGQVPWDNLSNSGWNILFSAFPVVVMGLFDQPVSPRALIAFPKLYAAGQRNTYFNLYTFAIHIFSSVYQSLIIFLMIKMSAFTADTIPDRSGRDSNIWWDGIVLYTAVLLTVTGKMMLTMRTWTYWNHLALWLSILIWFLYLVVIGSHYISLVSDTIRVYGVTKAILSTGPFWFTIILVPFTSLLPDIIVTYIQKTYEPSDMDIIAEQEHVQRHAHYYGLPSPTTTFPFASNDRPDDRTFGSRAPRTDDFDHERGTGAFFPTLHTATPKLGLLDSHRRRNQEMDTGRSKSSDLTLSTTLGQPQ